MTVVALPAFSLEIESSYDALHAPDTTIEGLHRFYVGVPLDDGLSFGQTLYSGAYGDGGGAFFWGFEGVKRLAISPSLGVAISGFLGGGGGAAQVVGDGTMWRLGVVGEYAVTHHWSLQAGVSRLQVNGAKLDGWATTLGLRYAPSAKTTENGRNDMGLSSAAFRVTQYAFPDVPSRSGTPQEDLKLMGAEARFDIAKGAEAFLGADGAVAGGDGYMQVLSGLRKRFPIGRASVFGQASVGFGGGGDVDTGGGFIAGAAAGIALPIAEKFDLELAHGVLTALDTSAKGHGSQISISRVLGRKVTDRQKSAAQRWQVSLGLSVQPPNDTYMKARSHDGILPIMQESSIDLFLGEKTYLTGNAQTTVSGGVAGYAVGLLGAGHELDLGEKWRLSIEGHVGAAGGGGVDVGRGVVAGVRGEIDYLLSDSNALSMGLGLLKSFDGGLSVPIVQIGFKHRFATR